MFRRKNTGFLVCVYIVWTDGTENGVVFTSRIEELEKHIKNESVLYSIITGVLACYPNRRENEIKSWRINLVH